MGNEPPKTNGIPGLKPEDGLFLKGLIVASEVAEKSWEGQSYKQLKLTITNGLKSFFYTMSDKSGELPAVELFKRASVRVDSATSDRGNLTVRGEFSYE